MDNHEKFDMVCKQFGSLQHPNPPMHIDWMTTVGWNLLFERENIDDTCLVYLHAENGIGIADRNVKGYTPTPCYIYNGVDGGKAVDWFNEHILGLSQIESTKIVLSTMRQS
jgi:hypothetical protein